MKAIVESDFEGSGVLETQPRAGLLTTGLATPLHKIKDRYKCLIKLEKRWKIKFFLTKIREQNA